VQYKNILAMIFNEIKCRVNISLSLVGGMHPLHLPCVRVCVINSHSNKICANISLSGTFSCFWYRDLLVVFFTM